MKKLICILLIICSFNMAVVFVDKIFGTQLRKRKLVFKLFLLGTIIALVKTEKMVLKSMLSMEKRLE